MMSDGQCATGLTCFQRSSGEAIPGCTDDGCCINRDYCYDPLATQQLSGGNDMPAIKELSGGKDANAKNLLACTGECDSDGQCTTSLTCSQRSNKADEVPMGLSLKKCKERCGTDEACACFKWDRTNGECLKMKRRRTTECAKSGTFVTYLHEASYNGYADKYTERARVYERGL